MVKVINEDGKLECKDTFIEVREASEVIILVKIFVKSERKYEWSRLEKELNSTTCNYEELLNDHIKLHQKLFNKVSFGLYGSNHELSNEQLLLSAYLGDVDKALIEKMWAFGRFFTNCVQSQWWAALHPYRAVERKV